MSRIGKKNILIPQGVEAKLEGQKFLVSGPKGKLELNFDPRIIVKIENGKISVSAQEKNDKVSKSLWGTTRALINNCVTGVTQGFSKKLEIVGVGYRAAADKQNLTLQLGYSHPVELPIPSVLEVKVEKNTITISGIDRHLVGQFAAHVRDQRPPEPYKGKGIKYSDEIIRRKAGKVVKAVGAA